MTKESDSQIQNDVMNELRWEPRVSHEEIGVAVHNGVVTLSGNVPNYAEKKASEQAAMRVRGVKGIAEDINVRIKGPHKKNDTEIAEAVTNAMIWHVWTPENLMAKVENGWVTLSGEAEHQYQRNSAANSVRYLAGVNGVSNNITVKPRVDVQNVKEMIEEALVRDAELDAENVRVSTDGGKVILSGDVHSYFEKQAAGSAAWRAAGVNNVQNKIRII